MAGGIEVKGILGSDKRMYLLDLLRLSIRDLNYEDNELH
jgi:protein TIF31